MNRYTALVVGFVVVALANLLGGNQTGALVITFPAFIGLGALRVPRRETVIGAALGELLPLVLWPHRAGVVTVMIVLAALLGVTIGADLRRSRVPA